MWDHWHNRHYVNHGGEKRIGEWLKIRNLMNVNFESGKTAESYVFGASKVKKAFQDASRMAKVEKWEKLHQFYKLTVEKIAKNIDESLYGHGIFAKNSPIGMLRRKIIQVLMGLYEKTTCFLGKMIKKMRVNKKKDDENFEKTLRKESEKAEKAKRTVLNQGLMALIQKSNMSRVGFEAFSIFKNFPFSSLFSLTVFLPLLFNISDKYVMNRARFGRYLSNNIRLAYEDFYYTFKTAQENNIPISKADIRAGAKYLLKVINDKDTSGSIQLSGYGVENRLLIMRFIFMLRCITLSILTYGMLPKYLPEPNEIDEIAYTIQKFMEANAWNAYLFNLRNDSKKTNIIFSAIYLRVVKNILSDAIIGSIFKKGCDKNCSKHYETVLRKHTIF